MIRVDLYSAAGAKLDVAPLVGNDILGCQYGLTLNKIGLFQLTVAANAASAAGLAIARQCWIDDSNEGLIFKGVIEDISSQVAGDGKQTLVVQGRSVAASLSWATTLLGRTFDNQTLASTVSTLVTGTQFSAGEIDSPLTNITVRMDGRSIWDALSGVAEVFALSLREDNIDSEIDIGAFGTATGITFLNVKEHSASLDENPYLYAIRSVKKRTYALDMANQIIPIAQQTGISGSTVWFSLANSDRTSPYTIDSATGPDSQTYYSISDDDSVATYGTRQRVTQVRDILPLSTAAADLTKAANTLYDEAVTFLQRHKDPIDEYEIEVTGLTHVLNGAYRFEVGDTFRVQFDGNALDSTGQTTTALTIDTDLYLMGFQRTYNVDGSDTWKLTLSNVLREIPNDGNITEQFMKQLQAVKAAPMPFVLIGDNAVRFSEVGMQLRGLLSSTLTGSTEKKVGWYADAAWTDLVAEMFGSAYNGGGLDNRNFYLRIIKDEFNEMVIGVYDAGAGDWHFAERITGESAFSGGSWIIEKDTTALLALSQTTPGDDSSWDLYILKNGTQVKVGGNVKATNDGPYMLPVGPERGVYFASDYTNWRPISQIISGIAAPTVTISSGGLGSVTMPATVDANDLLLAFCSSAVNGTHATPSGWTKLKEKADAGGGFPVTVACFYKVAAGTEDGTTVSFTAASVDACAHVYRILANTYTGTPAVSTSASGTVSSTNPDAVSFTGRALVFACAGYANTTVLAGNPYGNATNSLSSSGGTEQGIGTDWTSKDIVTSEDPGGFGGAVTTWAALSVAIRAADNDVVNAATITNLFVSPAATPDYIQVELATGAPGAESSIGETKIFPGEVTPFIPVDVSAGDRISARVSGGAAYLSLQILDTADQG